MAGTAGHAGGRQRRDPVRRPRGRAAGRRRRHLRPAGAGRGALSALVAFLLTRRRGGGIAVAGGLTVGGLAGSLLAWQLGTRLGPGTDVIANAKKAYQGVEFSAALELGAHGALLVWPMTAMVVLLALSAAFGKREQDPPPYWAAPNGSSRRARGTTRGSGNCDADLEKGDPCVIGQALLQ
ncbi:hypothetical protein ACFQ0T_32170 [Kitasatospora gansuensis]